MRFKVPNGATPISDSDGLIPEGIYNYADLCAAEAENILQAMDKHLKRRKNPDKVWLTEYYIRRVHADMFNKVWEWAGIYRVVQTNIGLPVHLIREEISKLSKDVEFWDSQGKSMPVIERTVRIHHRLAWIHPFTNGNGRHARFIADIYLYSHKLPLPNWPYNINSSGPARSQYLETLRKADHGDFQPLIDFTTKHIQ